MIERRKQQALRLTLPQPGLAQRSLNQSPSSSASTSSSSPGIDALSDLNKLSVLGSGNGGKVYKVCHKKTGAIYALKVVRFTEDDGTGIHEAEIFRRVDSSEYIVRCLGVFDGDFAEADGSGSGGGGICFVMEYMDAGSLHDILCKKKRLPEKVISAIVKSVLKGLQYLHGLKIVHRDIKPSNLLVNMRGQVKIADFGASRASDSEDGTAITTTGSGECRGTCAYMSPERMDPERWDGAQCDGYTGDVWSLGVVAMECLMGRFPLVGPDQKLDWVTLLFSICFGDDVESVVKMGSLEFGSFCKRCLEREWRKRGTVEELLLHPFISKYEDVGIDDVVSCIATSY